jgi:hypothetical protein
MQGEQQHKQASTIARTDLLLKVLRELVARREVARIRADRGRLGVVAHVAQDAHQRLSVLRLPVELDRVLKLHSTKHTQV